MIQLADVQRKFDSSPYNLCRGAEGNSSPRGRCSGVLARDLHMTNVIERR